MQYLFIFLKGLMMGAADLIPGVSGGTIALITGVYEKLLKSINSISWKNIVEIKRSGVKFVWNKINGGFLLTLLSGVITSILLFSWLLEWLFKNESIGLWSFFFGILLASFIFLIKIEIQKKTVSFFSLLIGIFISYQITKIAPSSIQTVSLWYIFLSGFFGITAMILPGISGAYILLLMGVYQIILSNIRQAQQLIFNFNEEVFVDVTQVLGIFFLGIILGIKFFTKLLTFLLDNYRNYVMSFLIGLMIGSLNKIWPWQNAVNKSNLIENHQVVPVLPHHYSGDDPELSKAITFILLGFASIFFLEKIKSFLKK
ncbi:DUF368 domain-containing protein [Bacteroidetes bacterium SCGC AAA795-G10]|nr:DUF368 domain-containing protein [Bacteroidetes bacterium SCGC AAA795-G10]